MMDKVFDHMRSYLHKRSISPRSRRISSYHIRKIEPFMVVYNQLCYCTTSSLIMKSPYSHHNEYFDRSHLSESSKILCKHNL